MNIIKFLKYRKQICQLIKYSFSEVTDYKYLSASEKAIIPDKSDYLEIRSLVDSIQPINIKSSELFPTLPHKLPPKLGTHDICPTKKKVDFYWTQRGTNGINEGLENRNISPTDIISISAVDDNYLVFFQKNV